MKDRGMSERHALQVAGMSASSLRYVVVPEEFTDLHAAMA